LVYLTYKCDIVVWIVQFFKTKKSGKKYCDYGI